MHAVRAILIAAVLVFAAACASKPKQAEPSATPVTRNRPKSSATLTMLEPAPAAVITGEILRVRLDLTGGHIILETKSALRPDEGHIHVLLDGKTVSMAYGLEQDVRVTKGAHLVQAEYVAADHSPFNPRVIVAATITVP